MQTAHFQQVVRKMNRLGRVRQPFFFFVDFDLRQSFCLTLDEIDPQHLQFELDGIQPLRELPDDAATRPLPKDFFFEKYPPKWDDYLQRFEKVMTEIRLGNTFLINLTQPTPIHTDLDLLTIYLHSRATFKFWLRDRMVIFSPERFVQMVNRHIFTHPMKGTADANAPDAATRILHSQKEAAEHATIVDLLRNDLNRVARQVHVQRFRYLTTIETQQGKLLQVSSAIAGTLPQHWQDNVGSIIAQLLPAGSVSGAPKRKTVEIILETEGYERGFYTGVFGFFDGMHLDSAVAIRFIEQLPDGSLIFKSGGGITFQSNAHDEYLELIKKVYVPITRNHQN